MNNVIKICGVMSILYSTTNESRLMSVYHSIPLKEMIFTSMIEPAFLLTYDFLFPFAVLRWEVRYTQLSDWICILVMPQGRDELAPLAQKLGLGEVQHALRSAKDAGAGQLKKLFFVWGGEVESEC